MLLKCPVCKSTDQLEIGKKPDGNITCMNCAHQDKYNAFKYRRQNLNELFNIITQLADKDLRIGQMIKIVEMGLEGQTIFYLENDKLLLALNKLL